MVEDESRRTPTWRAKCLISGSGRPLRFEHWVRAEISPPTYLHSSALLGSELRKEQHKRRKVYTGSGHHCGVIPYSSVWCGRLPQGLMMNNTREEQPREGCSCSSVDELSPPHGGWLVLYIESPWSSSQILSGKGANNWPF